MIKRLLSSIFLISTAVLSLSAKPETVTVWSGEETLTADNKIKIEAEKFDKLVEGSTMTLTFGETSDADSWGAEAIIGNFTGIQRWYSYATVKTLGGDKLTPENIEKIKQSGMTFASFDSKSAILKSVSYTVPEDPNVIWSDDEVAVGWGPTAAKITAEQMAQLQPGDVIKMTVRATSENFNSDEPKIFLRPIDSSKCPDDNWKENLPGAFRVGREEFNGQEAVTVEFGVTETLKSYAAGGLFPAGGNCNVSKIEKEPGAFDATGYYAYGERKSEAPVVLSQKVLPNVNRITVTGNGDLGNVRLATGLWGGEVLTQENATVDQTKHEYTFQPTAENLTALTNGDGTFRIVKSGWASGHVTGIKLYNDDNTTAITDIFTDVEEAPVDVYTVNGVLVRSGVKASDAVSGLTPGIYIIGGKKVLVK